MIFNLLFYFTEEPIVRRMSWISKEIMNFWILNSVKILKTMGTFADELNEICIMICPQAYWDQGINVVVWIIQSS